MITCEGRFETTFLVVMKITFLGGLVSYLSSESSLETTFGDDDDNLICQITFLGSLIPYSSIMI